MFKIYNLKFQKAKYYSINNNIFATTISENFDTDQFIAEFSAVNNIFLITNLKKKKTHKPY